MKGTFGPLETAACLAAAQQPEGGGRRSWAEIAEKVSAVLPNDKFRTAKQCRQWFNRHGEEKGVPMTSGAQVLATAACTGTKQSNWKVLTFFDASTNFGGLGGTPIVRCPQCHAVLRVPENAPIFHCVCGVSLRYDQPAAGGAASSPASATGGLTNAQRAPDSVPDNAPEVGAAVGAMMTRISCRRLIALVFGELRPGWEDAAETATIRYTALKPTVKCNTAPWQLALQQRAALPRRTKRVVAEAARPTAVEASPARWQQSPLPAIVPAKRAGIKAFLFVEPEAARPTAVEASPARWRQRASAAMARSGAIAPRRRDPPRISERVEVSAPCNMLCFVFVISCVPFFFSRYSLGLVAPLCELVRRACRSCRGRGKAHQREARHDDARTVR